MPRPERLVRNERGIALAIALFALVVIGGIVAGNFFAGVLEQQSGTNVLWTIQAAETAEGELRMALLSTSPGVLRSMLVGGPPVELGSTSAPPGFAVVNNASRLADNLFLVRSRSSRQNPGGPALATRAVGMLARLAPDSATGGETLAPLTRRPWIQLY